MDKLTERQVRDEVAALIMKKVAVDGWSNRLKVVAPDGTKPIVVALDHELLSAVLARVAWSSGVANVFIVSPTGSLRLVSFLPPADSLYEDDAERFAPNEIHRDITIGMAADTAMQYPAGMIVSVRLSSSRAGVVAEEQIDLQPTVTHR